MHKHVLVNWGKRMLRKMHTLGKVCTKIHTNIRVGKKKSLTNLILRYALQKKLRVFHNFD